MTVGVIPYATLKQNTMNLTAYFETSNGFPACYGITAGNWDGAGISYGFIQFNLKTGSLQPIFKYCNDNNPTACQNIFGANYNTWVSVITMTTADAIAWGNSISNTANMHTVNDPWKTSLLNLGALQECQTAQENGAVSYFNTAETWKTDFGLWSRRGYALMFDISVQAGGMTALCHSDILTQIGNINTTGMTRGQIETSKMNIIWQRRLQDIPTGNAAYAPFHDRKQAVANGSGTVYGSTFDTVPYDAILEPAYASDVLVVVTPTLSIVSASLGKVSYQTGFNSTVLTLGFDQAVQRYKVEEEGLDQNTGTQLADVYKQVADYQTTTVGSLATSQTVGGMRTVGSTSQNATITVNSTQLLKEGGNTINVYAQDLSGNWSAYHG